jgi:hypothetical protein
MRLTAQILDQRIRHAVECNPAHAIDSNQGSISPNAGSFPLIGEFSGRIKDMATGTRFARTLLSTAKDARR